MIGSRVRRDPGKKDRDGDSFGDVAQMGERLPCKQEVGGSNPLISTTAKFTNHSSEARKSNVL